MGPTNVLAALTILMGESDRRVGCSLTVSTSCFFLFVFFFVFGKMYFFLFFGFLCLFDIANVSRLYIYILYMSPSKIVPVRASTVWLYNDCHHTTMKR